MYEEQIEWLRTHAKSYEEMFGEGESSTMMRQAADAIEELVATVGTAYNELANNEANKPRWIPATERLPEDGQDILAVQSWDGEARIVPANYDRGLWYDCVFDYPAEHITHWMPLPEPPKEEN